MTETTSYTFIELLEAVDKIFMNSREKKEKNFNQNFELASPYLEEMANRLSITKKQSLIFTAVFFCNIHEREVNRSSLSHYLTCTALDMVKMEPELKALCNGMYVVREAEDFDNKPRYVILKRMMKCIIDNDLSELKSVGHDSESLTGRFYNAAYQLYKDVSRNFTNVVEFYTELEKLKLQYSELEFMKEAVKYNITQEDLVVYISVFVTTLEDNTSTDLNELGNNLYKTLEHKLRFRKKFARKDSVLFTENIIDYDESYYVEGRAVVFTDWFKEKVMAEFELEKVAKEYVPKICKLIKPTDLYKKKLIYSEQLSESVERIGKIISREKLEELQNRLSENGLPKGVTIMLHGYPGTGKTETVQQLAMQCNRDIYMVDISSIRNKYVGESEKNLKSIFEEYRKAVRINKNYPILLFNESDALIGKRITVDRSVDQMENSMQNILLQELEKFDGILFATTNLLTNLDKAFERRFLFKLKFEKPGIEVRESIWKEKLPELNENEILQLAGQFEFSGGQIDNIVKKIILEKALGGDITFSQIIKFCEEETFMNINNNNSLGFRILSKD